MNNALGPFTPIALDFLTSIAPLAKARIAYVVHSSLVFFPSFLAKLGIAHQHLSNVL